MPTLVCNVCHTLEHVDDQSIEADVVATNDGVLRYASAVGNSTIWKVGQPSAASAVPDHVSASSTGSPHLSTRVCQMPPPKRVASPAVLASEFDSADPAPFPVVPQPGPGGGSAYSSTTPTDLVARATDSCDADFRYFSLPAC